MKSLFTGRYLLSAILLIPGIAHAQAAPNREIIRKLYEECLNKRNTGLLQDLISADYVGVNGGRGVAAFEAPVAPLIQAFPDIQWKIEELVAGGDKVVVRWKWTGTHTGPFQGYAATGKRISNDGMAIFELKGGKVTGAQVQTDRVGFLQQLGALPSDLTLLAKRMPGKGQVRFIDKFIVPEKGEQEFKERVKINRDFIKTLPGFIEDNAYESRDGQGNLIYLTVAVWESEAAVRDAKEAVQAAYKKEGFDPAEMMGRLKISMDRGLYKEAGN
ncbi:MAG TPA: ester cyclase [Puia sp.]|nr:ester cyclase [Puia sp.]